MVECPPAIYRDQLQSLVLGNSRQLLYCFYTELLPSEYRLRCFSQEVVKNEVLGTAEQLVALLQQLLGKEKPTWQKSEVRKNEIPSPT